MSYQPFKDESPRKSTKVLEVMNPQQINRDVLVADESDKKFWTSGRAYRVKCFLRKAAVMLFNSGPVYFSYLFMSLYLYRLLRNVESDKAIREHYKKNLMFDYFKCVCITLVFIQFWTSLLNHLTLDELQRIYLHWSANCLVFILLYTVFITQKELKKIEELEVEKSQLIQEPGNKTQRYVFNFSFSYFISQQNYYCIGLGRSHYDFIQQQGNLGQDQVTQHVIHFQKQIEKIIEQQNLDPTLVYFAMSQDLFDVEDEAKPLAKRKTRAKMAKSVESKSVLEYLADLGFGGKRSIFQNFLTPHYVYTRKFQIPDQRVQAVVLLLIILVKIAVPTLQIILPIRLLSLYFTVIVTGFYLHFLSVVFDMVLNDDLKTKNYFFLSLNRLISINNIEEGQDPLLIDVTCALSLQSWDLMRRVTLYIESKKKAEYNYIYAFIALYGVGCFVAFILCRFSLPFMEAINYCDDPTLLYNIHADIVLTVFICMVRIFQGSQFNDTFEVIKENIHRLTSVYEDLYTLFDYYFQDQMSDQVENQIYREIIRLIYVNGRQQLKVADNRRKNKADLIDNELQIIMRDKVGEIRSTMLKIQKQVDRDQSKCQDKFIGLIDANFKKQTKIIMVVMITFVPDIFDKMSRYINQMI